MTELEFEPRFACTSLYLVQRPLLSYHEHSHSFRWWAHYLSAWAHPLLHALGPCLFTYFPPSAPRSIHNCGREGRKQGWWRSWGLMQSGGWPQLTTGSTRMKWPRGVVSLGPECWPSVPPPLVLGVYLGRAGLQRFSRRGSSWRAGVGDEGTLPCTTQTPPSLKELAIPLPNTGPSCWTSSQTIPKAPAGGGKPGWRPKGFLGVREEARGGQSTLQAGSILWNKPRPDEPLQHTSFLSVYMIASINRLLGSEIIRKKDSLILHFDTYCQTAFPKGLNQLALPSLGHEGVHFPMSYVGLSIFLIFTYLVNGKQTSLCTCISLIDHKEVQVINK